MINGENIHRKRTPCNQRKSTGNIMHTDRSVTNKSKHLIFTAITEECLFVVTVNHGGGGVGKRCVNSFIDRATRQPFDATWLRHSRVRQATMNRSGNFFRNWNRTLRSRQHAATTRTRARRWGLDITTAKTCAVKVNNAALNPAKRSAGKTHRRDSTNRQTGG